ncbi:Crp/Fnr family transcriptional regulator [Lutibaculum baratangense]|uniref:cAMP-binding protein n=1 Tax=Lutibaculum baratangense AMV1 TaxID=631454 RepID=V4TCY0_9HYPH|nr:Crp/Fnr family transcriptional regulator [Lutibaculum baratangense]ESR24163.1 cAMP-binding protein [Lutibaculum baratangense AMV1]
MNDTSQHLRNRLLAAMRPEDLERLVPHLQPMEMTAGVILYEPEDLLDTAYFPYDAVISIVSVMRDGGVAEMATVGREGVAGFAWPTSSGRAPGRHLVQLPGSGARMPLQRLHAVAAESVDLQHLLLRYMEVFLRETMQLAACNALHPVEARCARWILMTQDRVGSPELRLTQEFLSEMLGVQRTTVSLVTRTLERQGLIRNRRGLIEVIDRSGLEGASCECYRVIEDNLGRLLPLAPE